MEKSRNLKYTGLYLGYKTVYIANKKIKKINSFLRGSVIFFDETPFLPSLIISKYSYIIEHLT